MSDPRFTVNGLRAKRERTCEHCGAVFVTAKATSRFCSVECSRQAGSRYGRSYGHYAPRSYGVASS